MTRYTVVWHQEAQDELLELWFASENRNDFSIAANEIDRELRHDAHSKGMLQLGGYRSISRQPLRAYFRVNVDDRLVSVLRIRQL